MKRPLPPGRAAAIQTFATCRTRSTGRHEGAGNKEAVARRAPPDSTTQPHATVEHRKTNERARQYWRLVLAVFAPFAAGYYLSYLFRTINASISPALASEFGLDAAQTGLLASVYFLVVAGAQIPIGVFLDRFGPRRVQGALLVIAVGGAALFGNADGFIELLLGRAMIGLGVAGSFVAALKAIVIWFPRERIAFINGCMIMLGSLGAITATAPTDWLLVWIGWRGLFEVLTFVTVTVAGLIYFSVPQREPNPDTSMSSQSSLSLWSVFTDARFLRIAPLSAACVGSSWALQSLWAVPWLADVEGFDRQSQMTQLSIMAICLSLGALTLGTIADRLRKRGIRVEVLFAATAVLFILAELALVLHAPLPPLLPWSFVSVVGAATVLSYAMVADYFPKELAARANGALNLLHFGWAFVVQYGTGLILGQWLPHEGHYPTVAYQVALGCIVALQVVALMWFAMPWIRRVSRNIWLLFVPLSAERGGPGGSIFQPADCPVLEACEGVEW